MKQSPSILIVDDHPPTAKSLLKLLKRKHAAWEIKTACGVSEALQSMRETSFDAVVTDYRLDDAPVPAKNGLKVIQQAKSNDAFCVTILMTAFPEDFDRYKDALYNGADDCIVKNQRGINAAAEIMFKLEQGLQRRWHQYAYLYSRHLDPKLRESGRLLEELRDLGKRNLTMMFVKVRGLARTLNLEISEAFNIQALMERMYALISSAVHQHGGMVEKFTGDACMCFFGLFETPNDPNSCAEHAVNAALKIQHAWRILCEDMHQIPQLSLGLGIHSEEMLTGTIQTEEHDQFTVIGEGIYLTRQVENLAENQTSHHGLFSSHSELSALFITDETKKLTKGCGFRTGRKPAGELASSAGSRMIWHVQGKSK